MNKEIEEKILKAEFMLDDDENNWVKFNGDKEFYIQYSVDGFKHIFAYAPLDDVGNQDEEKSYYEEKVFEELNLHWFNYLDDQF